MNESKKKMLRIVIALVGTLIIWGFLLPILTKFAFFRDVEIGGFFSSYGKGTLILFGVGAVVVIMIIMGLSKMGKKENEKDKEKYGLIDNIKDNIKAKIVKATQITSAPGADYLLEKADFKDPTPGGGTDKEEWSFSIKDIWMELMTQMNYLLRLQVYMAKKASVANESDRMVKIYSAFDPVDAGEGKGGKESKKYNVSEINVKLDIFKNGSGYKFSNTGRWRGRDVEAGPEYEIRDSITTKKGFKSDMWFITNDGELKLGVDAAQDPYLGINSDHFLIFELFKRMILDITTGPITLEEKQNADRAAKDRKSELYGAIRTFGWKVMNANASRGSAYIKRRGAWNIIDSSRKLYIGQYLLCGEYKHIYKFARVGAKIYEAGYTVNDKHPFFEVQKGAKGGQYAIEPEVKKLNHEVDKDGYFLEDLNRIKFTGQGVLRKVDRFERIDNFPKSGEITWVPCIIDYPDWRPVIKGMDNEWDFFIRDMRFGEFHPNSKTFQDYAAVHKRKLKIYEGMIKISGTPGGGNPAFDREALKDIGKSTYWGKKWPWSSFDSINKAPTNNFPCLTNYGLSSYNGNFIARFADEYGMLQREKLVWDSGKKNVFTGKPEEEKK